MAESPLPPDDEVPEHRTESLAAASARLAAVHKLDGSLYRVVEVTRQANGRLSRQGQIWHSDLSLARRFGRALAANSAAQKVQVADADGQVIETIPPPPPGTPAPGWGDWRAAPLPPAPPVVRRAPPRPRPVAKAAPAPVPAPPAVAPETPPLATIAPAAPTMLPVMAPENEVERTSTLTP
jgi:hypothetical protein